MSDESSKEPPDASHNSLTPAFNYISSKPQVKFEINLWPFSVGKGFALGNFLIGTAVLAKNLILINTDILDIVFDFTNTGGLFFLSYGYLMVVGLLKK